MKTITEAFDEEVMRHHIDELRKQLADVTADNVRLKGLVKEVPMWILTARLDAKAGRQTKLPARFYEKLNA